MSEFSVGDHVRIKAPYRPTGYDDGLITSVALIGGERAVSIKNKAGMESWWYEWAVEYAYSAHEDYALAVQYLGEDYFA